MAVEPEDLNSQVRVRWISVPYLWRKPTRREQELLERALEKAARRLTDKWDAADAVDGGGDA